MIIILILLSGLCLFALSRFYQKTWDKNLSFRLDFDSQAVYAGEKAGLSEVIENRKKLPVPFLEIGFRIQKGILLPDAENVLTSDYVYKRDLFSLLGMESITRHYTAECPRRGCYSFSQMVMNCRSLLFRYTYTKELQCDKNLYVYAARTDVSDILPALESMFGEFESSRKYLEDPFAFSGIRSYTLQDPMKTINWKASARTGSLMVNTFTSVLSSRIMVYLDVSDRFLLKKDDLLEACISSAATLCSLFIGQGMETGLFVNAPEGANTVFYLPPARGRQQLKMIEQFLTGNFSSEVLPDYAGSLRSLHLEAGTFPVFLSINADDEIKGSILSLLGEESEGLWIVPLEKGQELPVTGAKNLEIVGKETGL